MVQILIDNDKGEQTEYTGPVVAIYEGLFYVDKEGNELEDCFLEVKLTHEGLIMDLWHGDECVATFGQTADELVQLLIQLQG